MANNSSYKCLIFLEKLDGEHFRGEKTTLISEVFVRYLKYLNGMLTGKQTDGNLFSFIYRLALVPAQRVMGCQSGQKAKCYTETKNLKSRVCCLSILSFACVLSILSCTGVLSILSCASVLSILSCANVLLILSSACALLILSCVTLCSLG